MKKFFSLFLAGAYLAAAGCGSAPDGNTKSGGDTQVLNLYSWADNFSPDVLSDFEKKYNCKINYDVFANNEELLAKIQAGGSEYDVIQPSDYMVATMIKLDLLEKLDKSKIKNTENMLPALIIPPMTLRAPTQWSTPGASQASLTTQNTSKIRPAHGMICGKTNTKAVSFCSTTTVKSSAWDSRKTGIP